jgi:hypothetical protein
LLVELFDIGRNTMMNTVSHTGFTTDHFEISIRIKLSSLLRCQPGAQKALSLFFRVSRSKRLTEKGGERVPPRSSTRATSEIEHCLTSSAADEAGKKQRFLGGGIKRRDATRFTSSRPYRGRIA